MAQFKKGDKVRLKGYDIEGEVCSTLTHLPQVYVRFAFTPPSFVDGNAINPAALELVPQPFEVHRGDRLTYVGGSTFRSSYDYELTPEQARTNNLIKVERPVSYETIYEA